MRDFLENYNNYKAGIKKAELKILELESDEPSPSSPNFEINGDIRSKGKINDAGKSSDKKIDTINKLKRKVKILQARIDYIDSLVNTLDDYHRELIRLKYMYNKTSAKIASIVYRSKRSVNKELKNALAELELKHEESLEKFPFCSY